MLLSALLSGCDSGAGEVADGASVPSAPSAARPNPTLNVNLATAARGWGRLAELQVLVYDVRGANLAERTVSPGQDAAFSDLPAGSVMIRVIGRDSAHTLLGFSDVDAAIPTHARVDARALQSANTVPPPATPGTAFLGFTGLPAVYQAGVPYTIEVSAFNAQGELDTTASGSIGLSSSGVSAAMAEAGVLFNKGHAVFPPVVFPPGSNGTVSFTASAAGYQSVVSPTLPVRSN
jgi:hypothetical protein